LAITAGLAFNAGLVRTGFAFTTGALAAGLAAIVFLTGLADLTGFTGRDGLVNAGLTGADLPVEGAFDGAFDAARFVTGDGFARDGLFDDDLATWTPFSFHHALFQSQYGQNAIARWTERLLIAHKAGGVKKLMCGFKPANRVTFV
jgi:hypothetical protein